MGLVAELKHQDRDSHCIIEPFRHPKRLQQSFGTVAFGARKIVKNIFALLQATCQIPRRFWVAKILLQSRIVTQDSAGADAFAFVHYMDYKNQLIFLDETLTSVCLLWITDDEQDYTRSSWKAKRKRRLWALGNWVRRRAVQYHSWKRR